MKRGEPASCAEARFYVVHHARGDERRDVPYVLAIDAEGKVARVE
jgi:hypothetical protein